MIKQNTKILSREVVLQKKIIVLMGGFSSERGISLKSGRAVTRALGEAGFKEVMALQINGGAEGLREKIQKREADMAFLALHGKFGEDGVLQEMLDKWGILYTGSGPEASRVALDKVTAKEIFKEKGIPTPRFYVLQAGSKDEERKFKDYFSGRSLIVKPAREGSAVGITLVKTEKEYNAALKKAFQYDEKILVEDYIEGQEITVGILGASALPVVEISPRGEFYDFEAKYTEGKTDYKVPATISAEISRRAQSLALRTHTELGCRDFSRVDIKMDSSGELYVLEINTIPGMTHLSLLPKAAEAAGISFPELCFQIVQMALKKK